MQRRKESHAGVHIAFVGRSNVGKSSLLNSLAGEKLAGVSSSPGKTKRISFFPWRAFGIDWVLVDLPGYGFANTSKTNKEKWGSEITEFFSSEIGKQTLVCALIDGRHGFFENDLELLGFLKENSMHYVVVFTKMDKWKSNNRELTARKELKAFCKKLEVNAAVFTSSHRPKGLQELRVFLASVLRSKIKTGPT